MSAPKKISLSGLPRGELEAFAERLLAENAALRQAIAELRAEVATLEGLQGVGWYEDECAERQDNGLDDACS